MNKDNRNNTFIKIDCPKCKGKQGIIRDKEIKIYCFVCKRFIGVLK